MSTLLQPREPEAPSENSSVMTAVMIGVVIAALFALGGFFLIQDKSGSMGSVLFLLLPFATSFATSLVAPPELVWNQLKPFNRIESLRGSETKDQGSEMICHQTH
jgi:uncharacterized membrane protein YkgB